MIELTHGDWQATRQSHGNDSLLSNQHTVQDEHVLHPLRSPQAIAALEQVRSITESVFSANYKCSEQEDCEIPGDWYFELSVEATGTVDDILARNERWHQAIAVLPNNLRALFRLAIDAKDE